MADTYTTLNPGVGGDKMDETAVVIGGVSVKRPRVVVGGDDGELAKIENTTPAENDYGLVTRNIPIKTTTGTTSSVAGSGSNQTLAASNTSRLGLTIYNDSTANLYIKLGSVATLSDFTIKIAARGYYELPYNYTGKIDGIWDSATGNARITELTG